MYELFLTASVDEADFGTACSILSGLCGMPPWESVVRVLYYQGPSKPSGISNQSSIEKPLRKDTAFLWKELHQSLSRQSFILQARYEISKERDLGSDAPRQDLDAIPGTLRWTDFPDPPHGKPALTSRKAVELWEQKHLPTVLRDNFHTYKAETIEEMYIFFRDEVEFCLYRQLFFQPISTYVPLSPNQGSSTVAPAEVLPAWDELTPVDGENRWILRVRSHVTQDNKPDEIRRAQEKLLSIRGELEGVFDFKATDRKVHDTRIAIQQQGVQALPQKVTIGK